MDKPTINTPPNTKLTNEELERLFTFNASDVVTFVTTVLGESVKLGASDIFFEPRQQQVQIRARVDGVLYELGEVDNNKYLAISSRIKVLAKLDPTEKRKVQEGQLIIKVQERLVNLRIEIAQVVYGEIIVIRVHERETIIMDLSKLGLNEHAYKTYQSMLQQKSGLILVSGPTGSGKTTTLYSTISKLNENRDYNIMTIEDPVEFKLDGINQMQVDQSTDFTFAVGLHTILRLSPDVVLVGEIRDKETAKIAIESGLTGQLVLSTAHAEDSTRTIFRLLDLGVETYFLNSALMGVIAQRLVRKICDKCKTEVTPNQSEIEIFQNIMGREPKRIMKGIGCPECNSIGYKGRIGIYEVLYMNSSVRDLIRQQTNEEELRQLLIKDGFTTLLKDGLEKAENGVTTIEEVLRNSVRVA